MSIQVKFLTCLSHPWLRSFVNATTKSTSSAFLSKSAVARLPWRLGSVVLLTVFPKSSDWLIRHLPAYALPVLAKVAPLDELNEEHARQFEETIDEKRALYGLYLPMKARCNMMLSGEKGVIAHYMIDCRSRNLSTWTLDIYSRSLRLLVGLLVQVCEVSELEQVTVLHLRLCMQHLLSSPSSPESKGRRVKNGQTLSARSVRDYVLVWKSFFNWCYQEELIEKNPVARLKLPVIEKHIKPTITSDELQMMLDSCDLRTDMGFRDYAILLLLVDSGIRLAEISGLHVDDVYAGYIKVFGKGRREREVGLHPGVEKVIWKYTQKYSSSLQSGRDSTVPHPAR